MSDSSDLIYLPVSLGEAIDKLTILDIKLEKIKDNRRLDVQKEYDLLYEKLKEFLIKYDDLYQSMKKVNLLIWNMMDILRDGNISNEEYLKVCKESIEYNDIRFRVKNKINYVSESLLKEQKSYKVNRLLIDINNNMNEYNVYDFIRPIKYYSFFYDEIVIVYKGIDTILKDEFKYDPTIIFRGGYELPLDNMNVNPDIGESFIPVNITNYNKCFVFSDNNTNNNILKNFQLDVDKINLLL